MTIALTGAKEKRTLVWRVLRAGNGSHLDATDPTASTGQADLFRRVDTRGHGRWQVYRGQSRGKTWLAVVAECLVKLTIAQDDSG